VHKINGQKSNGIENIAYFFRIHQRDGVFKHCTDSNFQDAKRKDCSMPQEDMMQPSTHLKRAGSLSRAQMLQRQGAGIDDEEAEASKAPPPVLEAAAPLPACAFALEADSPFEEGGAWSRRACSK
jgi:hypothetical protein